MKKILLTSSGLGNKKVQKEFLNLLDKQIKDIKILLVFGVKTEEEMLYVEESKKELIVLGIQEKNIANANINEDIPLLEKDFDVIYFCGGNTYYLLDRIKKLDLDSLIKNLIIKGAIYIGVSAGSIIASKDIKIAGWGAEGDENEVELEDLSGLGFTNIAIFPHYKNSLKEEIKEFKKKVDYPVQELRDGEAILIMGNKVKKIK